VPFNTSSAPPTARIALLTLLSAPASSAAVSPAVSTVVRPACPARWRITSSGRPSATSKSDVSSRMRVFKSTTHSS